MTEIKGVLDSLVISLDNNQVISFKVSTDVKSFYEQNKSELVSVRSDIDIKRAFKYFDEAGQSTLNDTMFTHYRVYIGSSKYETKEMSILIDGIVSEAKVLGITVMSEREISLIKDDWRENSAG